MYQVFELLKDKSEERNKILSELNKIEISSWPRKIKLSKNIDIYIDVKYGVRIPETAWKLQRRIKEELATVTDIPVLQVNVHVQGVDFSNQEEDL